MKILSKAAALGTVVLAATVVVEKLLEAKDRLAKRVRK